MAVAIRLTRVGRRKSPYYRLVVADSRFPRDGRFIEILGHYQPLKQEIKLEIDQERALHWLDVGAQPSDTVRSLMRKKGIMKVWHERRVERKKARKAEQTVAEPAAAPQPAPEAQAQPPAVG
jgi:small subunit ribosomal protein S16